MSNRIADPTRLADVVEYHDGSVVSRVLFRNVSGTLTAFAFAEGEGLSAHSNPNDAIVHVLDGSLRITIGEEEFDLQTGDVLHLPPDVSHTLHGGRPFKMLLSILKRETT
jgi:quercetin dioxygenase-like cupin family protein